MEDKKKSQEKLLDTNKIKLLYDIYRTNGLNAEDQAYSTRSLILLTVNSILIVAFIGIFHNNFDSKLLSLMQIGLPVLAVLLNIIWLWLGGRTFLSFIFYFRSIENFERDLKTPEQYFNYAQKRKDFWKERKRKCPLSLIAVKAGANKVFCFWIPLLMYIVWSGILVYILIEKNRLITGAVFVIEIIILIISIMIFVCICKLLNSYNPLDFQRYAWRKYFKQVLDISDFSIKIEIKDDKNCYFVASQKGWCPTLLKGSCSGTENMKLIDHPVQEFKDHKKKLGKVQVLLRGQEHDKFDDIDSYLTFVRK